MLKKQIQKNSNEALKSGNSFLLGTLRMLLATIQTKEKDKKYKIGKEVDLTEEEVIDIVFSEIKKRKDAIALYKQGNRLELAEREEKEIEILMKYLPEQLKEEEIKKIVQESVIKIGATSIKEMGKIMADLNSKVKGRADGGLVSKIVKEFLSK